MSRSLNISNGFVLAPVFFYIEIDIRTPVRQESDSVPKKFGVQIMYKQDEGRELFEGSQLVQETRTVVLS